MATYTIDLPKASATDDRRGYEVTAGGVTIKACHRCHYQAVQRVGGRHGVLRCQCCAELLAPFKCDVCGRDA